MDARERGRARNAKDRSKIDEIENATKACHRHRVDEEWSIQISKPPLIVIK
jgi:hypothetical protein